MPNSITNRDLVAGRMAIWSEARFDTTTMLDIDAASSELRRAVRRLCSALVDTRTKKEDDESVFIEFMSCHCDAGAPEGALFINGHMAGFLPVQNL